MYFFMVFFFFFSSRRRHTRCLSDWSSDVCSSDLLPRLFQRVLACAGEVIGTCVLARREFGADYWKLMHQAYAAAEARAIRSEERRVGKECRSRWSPYQ